MMFDRRGLLLAGAFLGLAVGQARAVSNAPDSAPDTALNAAIQSDLRTQRDKARDEYRHPAQSLAFWGLKPGQTVMDIQPGNGWWTDILAPYLAHTGGTYIAATTDLDDPSISDGARKSRAAFEAKYQGRPDMFGRIVVVGFGRRSGPLAPPGTVDLVLVSRETHNWVRDGFIAKAFSDFHAALKHGGILAIEDHRAAEGTDPAGTTGYIPESYVIDQAKKAGFALAGRTEINANPKDTKDYPFGVWTLPPTRQSAPDGKPADPAFDRAKYDAIGESDRMTLKFIKP